MNEAADWISDAEILAAVERQKRALLKRGVRKELADRLAWEFAYIERLLARVELPNDKS